jgi:hypothetical protein
MILGEFEGKVPIHQSNKFKPILISNKIHSKTCKKNCKNMVRNGKIFKKNSEDQNF